MPATTFEVLSALEPVLGGEGHLFPLHTHGKHECFTQFSYRSVPQLVAPGIPEPHRGNHQHHSHLEKWETEAESTEVVSVRAQPASPSPSRAAASLQAMAQLSIHIPVSEVEVALIGRLINY